MNDKNFWNDASKYGAMLGLLMLASQIVETMCIMSGKMGLIALYGVEWLVVTAAYVVLLWYVTRRRAKLYSEEEGFTFWQAWSFVITTALFAGIIVGLGAYLYLHFAVGYSRYIDGTVATMTAALDMAGNIPSSLAAVYEQMFDQIQSAPEPSLLSTVINSATNYILGGGIVGLIIAATVKRRSDVFGDDDLTDGEI